MSADKDERFDYEEYLSELSEDEQKWVKQFYDEYYFNGKPETEGERIIKDPEMRKEANRNNNYYSRDLMFRAKKDNNLLEINENAREFMEDAHDDWEWEDAYKMFGYEEALQTITRQAIRDLTVGKIDIETALMRYYEKRDRLRRQLNREKR